MSVVISDNIVLAPYVAPAAINYSYPLIGYKNHVSKNNVSATSSQTLYPISNVSNISTASLWKSDSLSVQYVTSVLGTSEHIDYIGIAKHNFGSGRIALSVQIQNESGGTWTTVVSGYMPTDDKELLFVFLKQYVYAVRIELQPTTTKPQIGVMYVGDLLVCPQRIYVGHSPITLNRKIDVVNGRSESGNFLGRIVTGSSMETSVSLTHLDPRWYRTYFDPFVRNAETKPFFWAWKFRTYPDEVAFGWLSNDVSPSNMMSNGMMQVDFSMIGIAT